MVSVLPAEVSGPEAPAHPSLIPTFRTRVGGFVDEPPQPSRPPSAGASADDGPVDITVVVPTFGRHEILVETVERILATRPPPAAVIVVDQTAHHPSAVFKKLRTLANQGAIRWLRVARPSQPGAMNLGLLAARTRYVLFNDDDVAPSPGILAEFGKAFRDVALIEPSCWCVCGQVVQPQESVISIDVRRRYTKFPFNSDRRCFVDDAMAGNLCVDRRRALELGGFDENFVGAAYRCETEFVRRAVRAGGRVLFEPKAALRHLRAPTGGVRRYGDNRRTWRPYFPVGSYYLALREGRQEAIKTALWLPWRASATKYHLRHPWFIPVTLVSNGLGVGWAFALWARGPRLISWARARASLARLDDSHAGAVGPANREEMVRL